MEWDVFDIAGVIFSEEVFEDVTDGAVQIHFWDCSLDNLLDESIGISFKLLFRLLSVNLEDQLIKLIFS